MSADSDKIMRIKECIFLLYAKVQNHDNIGRLEHSRLNTFYIPSARGLNEEFFDEMCELMGDNLYFIDTVEESSIFNSKIAYEKFFFSLIAVLQNEKDMLFGAIPARFKVIRRLQGASVKKVEKEWSGYLFQVASKLSKTLSCGFVIKERKVIEMMLTYFTPAEILKNFPICLPLQRNLIVKQSVETFCYN